jgi:lipid II:glycine glycyltransferase (peptidoglycan interpeptide bridge formation enzyme)
LKGALLLSLTPADLGSCGGAGRFLQSAFWGSFKARFGWNARAFRALWAAPSGEEEKPLLVIRRRLGPGVSFAYVPWGPELPGPLNGDADRRNAALLELALSLKAFLPGDTAFIRFDPPWYAEGAPPVPPALPFIRAGADVQPPDTVLIDLKGLEGGPEALLAGMKPKWRYNARLALKRGVLVRRADEEGLGSFYALLRETAGRDGIAIHSIEYYRTLFAHSREWEAAPAPDIRLYLAEHEGDVLAGIITLFRGPEAVYLYGASSDRKRNLMAPYALQLRAMEDARLAGCGEYDLFGIPPSEDPGHPMAGLYRFKTGFGGRIVHRAGSWDLAYKPFVYRLFRAAETLRKTLRGLKKKRASHRFAGEALRAQSAIHGTRPE